MATKCTNKKPLTVNKRSHALNATKSKQKPNLIKMVIDGKKVVTSAREARTARKSAK
jgi:ribosomal protein L28